MALELFDLNALSDRFGHNPRIARVAPAVREASSMSSVKNDLARASEMLSASKALQHEAKNEVQEGGGVSREKAATIQALFSQAVLLYTRAVHSSGSARNKLQVLNFLPGSLRPAHDRITGLRDKYLAHFGDPGDWERHRTVLALDIERQRMALSYPHESYYVRAEEAQDLETLLKASVTIADQAFTRASERLNLILNDLFDNHADFLLELREVPFEPGGFFGPDEIEGYLTGIGNLDPDPHTSPRIELPSTRGPRDSHHEGNERDL